MKNFLNQFLLPAVTLEDVNAAMHLAETFLRNGLDVMEITFRTKAAAASIQVIRKEFPEMRVGAGTLLLSAQVTSAVDAGAQFGLSPGLNEEVALAAQKNDFPFIPGVSTPSEIEKAVQLGFHTLKLFPIRTLGETIFIKNLEGPYGHLDLQFVPMGGISMENMNEYLGCQSVVAVGGSWLAPGRLMKAGDFIEIGNRVRQALELVSAKR